MAINFPGNIGLKNIFPHSREFDTGGGNVRIGQGDIIVAQDETGDTDNLNDAMDLLPALGGTIYIKEGIYLFDSEITITKTIKFLGTGITSVIKSITLPLNGDLLHANSVNNIIFENLKIYSNRNGIELVECDNCIIKNCFFECDKSIRIFGCKKVTIKDNYFEPDSISIGLYISGAVRCKFITIENNYRTGGGSYFLVIKDTDYSTIGSNYVENTSYSCCKLGESSTGSNGGSFNIFSRNILNTTAGGGGACITVADSSSEHNIICNNILKSTNNGFYQSNGDNTLIIGNQTKNVNIAGGTGNDVHNIII